MRKSKTKHLKHTQNRVVGQDQIRFPLLTSQCLRVTQAFKLYILSDEIGGTKCTERFSGVARLSSSLSKMCAIIVLNSTITSAVQMENRAL